MNLEQLFEFFSEELQEIYENYELKKHTIEMIESAVKESFDNKQIINTSDFIEIISFVAGGTYQVDNYGKNVSMDYKEILRRVQHAKKTYIDDELNTSYAHSEEQHNYS